MNDTMSVALLVDTPTLQGWEYRTVRHLLDHTDAEIGVVIVNNSSGLDTSLRTIFNEFSFWTLYSAHRRLVWILRGTPWYRESMSIPGKDDTTELRVTPEPADGFGHTLPARAIEELTDHDLAVRFGFGVLKGDALTAPEHGILSFHHGDLREYRGQPAGFWELLHNNRTVGITVQRLSETLDGGEIVAFETMDIDGVRSWPVVLSRLFSASEPLLAKAVKNLYADEFETPENIGTLYTTPEWQDTLQYLAFRFGLSRN